MARIQIVVVLDSDKVASPADQAYPLNVAEDLLRDGFDMSQYHEAHPAIESAEWL